MAGNETRPSLLRRVQNSGDGQAWREFDERYRDLILRYCRRRDLQEADAEDVRQQVMLGLTQSLPRFTYDPTKGKRGN